MKQTNLSVLKKRLLLAVMGLLAIFAFWPTFSNDFVTWDDGAYVRENPYIEFNLENIKSTFSEYYMRHYHPLTMLSLSLDHEMAGVDNPLPYHATSLLFHVFNTFLVFGLILILFKRFDLAIMTGILFAVHPLHVESVAWISERKDVLFAFFYLASLVLYAKFLKAKNWKLYALSILLFVCSLLSKAQAVSLIIALPLIDYVLDQKLFDKKLLLNKLPYLALAIAMSVIAYLADTGEGPEVAGQVFTYFQKLVLSAWGFALYIGKSFFPINLLPFYPFPEAPRTIFFATFYTLPILYLGAIWFFRKNKIVLWSMIFFAINLAMFLPALTPIRITIIADRYGYLPVISTSLVTCYLLLRLIERFPQTKYYTLSFFVAYTGFFIYQNFQQTKIWNNGITLWTPVIEAHPEHHTAWHNRGNARLLVKDYKGALEDYNKTIEIAPNLAIAHYNRGNTYLHLEEKEKAHTEYSRALELEPNYAKALYRRGMLRYQLLDNANGAVIDLLKLSQLTPRDRKAFEHLSQALLKAGEFDNACLALKHAINLGSSKYIPAYIEKCQK